MKGYIARKGDRFYAVIYEGLDPLTGRERRRWHPAGTFETQARLLAARRQVLEIHTVSRRAFDDAIRRGLMLSNPASIAHAPRRRPLASAASRAWNALQLRAFLDVTEGHRFQVVLWVAANTGMRRGELLGLRCGDVDLDARTVDMLRTCASRDDDAYLFARDDDAYLFARDDGAPYHPQLLSDAFKKLVHRSGLPRIRLHDLRHTHATLLLKAGVPIKVVSERLGHSTPGFTMATYQHVLPGMQAEAAKTFAELLAPLPASTR